MTPGNLPRRPADDMLAAVRSMVSACMQCGTCSASCPNAGQMDLTPRKMWRLVTLGRLAEVMDSRSFILCSDCYTCTLRCPRGLPLTEAMESLKGIAFARQETRHRSSRLFYDRFVRTVQRNGRLHEIALMTGYFAALKNPLVPLRFAPLGMKLMRKGKVALRSRKAATAPLTALFDKVAALEGESGDHQAKEGRG